MLVETIFKGNSRKINFLFLHDLLIGAHQVYFNFPVSVKDVTPPNILATVNGNTYVDLVINTNNLLVNGKFVRKVFINLGKQDDLIDILFFFNVDDLGLDDSKANLKLLKLWAEKFAIMFGFEYFICQFDNAEKNEYYFDANGYGPLYDNL